MNETFQTLNFESTPNPQSKTGTQASLNDSIVPSTKTISHSHNCHTVAASSTMESGRSFEIFSCQKQRAMYQIFDSASAIGAESKILHWSRLVWFSPTSQS
jgi:hypothetical protein